MVIPFHASGINPIEGAKTNVDLNTDFTTEQNTTKATEKYKQLEGESYQDYYQRIAGRQKKVGSGTSAKTIYDNGRLSYGSKVDGKTWSWSFYDDLAETEDPVQSARNYVEACQEQGYIPKFPEFVYNEDGSFNENYYKLLTDFTLYDCDGEYCPQHEVTWTKDSLPKNWKQHLMDGLKNEQDIQNRIDAEADAIIGEVNKKLKSNRVNRQIKSIDMGIQTKKKAVRDTVSSQIDMLTAAAAGKQNKVEYPQAKYTGKDQVSYKTLISMPAMKIVPVRHKVAANRSEVISEALKYAGAEPNASHAVVKNNYTGTDIIIDKNGLDHNLHNDDLLKRNADYARYLGEILENSIKVNELDPRNKGEIRSDLYIGIAEEANGDPVIVRTNVAIYEGGRAHVLGEVEFIHGLLYSHIGQKIEPLAKIGRGVRQMPYPLSVPISVYLIC